jgi:hypothetical protein
LKALWGSVQWHWCVHLPSVHVLDRSRHIWHAHARRGVVHRGSWLEVEPRSRCVCATHLRLGGEEHVFKAAGVVSLSLRAGQLRFRSNDAELLLLHAELLLFHA